MGRELFYSELKSFFGDVPLFIFPTNTYGGHEVMSLEIIKELLSQGCSVKVAVEPENNKLIEELKIINPGNEVIILPIKQARFEFLHAIFNLRKKIKAEKFMSMMMRHDFSSTVIVQGDIELGAIYVEAAKKIKMPFYSYIPYAHTAKKMGKKLAGLRDFYYPYVYRKVDNFITISNVFSQELQVYNQKCTTYIIKNKIRDISHVINKRIELADNRKDNTLRATVIGRVNFKQKGQDVLLKAIQAIPQNIRAQLVIDIIGNGPDLNSLKEKVSAMNLNNVFKFHDWCKEPWEIAFNNDLLIIPSRFEGVPLVMLEGLAIGIDIIATKADGMVDYLDDTMLFNDANELAHLLEMKIKNKK